MPQTRFMRKIIKRTVKRETKGHYFGGLYQKRPGNHVMLLLECGHEVVRKGETQMMGFKRTNCEFCEELAGEGY